MVDIFVEKCENAFQLDGWHIAPNSASERSDLFCILYWTTGIRGNQGLSRHLYRKQPRNVGVRRCIRENHQFGRVIIVPNFAEIIIQETVSC
jgi:hypothetical protein